MAKVLYKLVDFKCDQYRSFSYICIYLFVSIEKRGKQQVFKNLYTEISVSAISFWSLFQFFFSQDFPETFPWILSDNIFFVSKFWTFWEVAYASFLVCFNNKTHHRDGQPGSLQTQSLTCKKRDWFPVIIQTLVSL